MDISDVNKNQKELAQIYLIITSLIITLKPNNALTNLKVINITQNVLLNVLFYGFIVSFLSYYVFISFPEGQKNPGLISLSSKIVAVSFTSIICICIVEPIISSYIDNPVSFFIFSLIISVTLISLAIFTSMALENKFFNIFKNLDFQILIIATEILLFWILSGTVIQQPTLWFGWILLNFFLFLVTCVYFCINGQYLSRFLKKLKGFYPKSN
jgi:hypothetical protein